MFGDRVEKFFRDMIEEKFSAFHIFSETIRTDLELNDILFMFGLEQNDRIMILNAAKNQWEEREMEPLLDIHTYFLEAADMPEEEKPCFSFCRCVGGVIEQDKKGGNSVCPECKVYCFIALNPDFHIDPTYFQIVCEIYYRWISCYMPRILSAVTYPEGLLGKNRDINMKIFFRNCVDSFHKYMIEIYGIELDIITGLSGSYYEGDSCCSRITFLLSDLAAAASYEGITFQESVEICVENTRKIRKLLQMGSEDQCLLAYMEDGRWRIIGLYRCSSLSGITITFHILRHMVWQMFMGEKLAYRLWGIAACFY